MVSLELRELGEVLEKLGLLQRQPLRQCWAFASEEGDNVFSRFCDERPGRGSRAVPECCGMFIGDSASPVICPVAGILVYCHVN